MSDKLKLSTTEQDSTSDTVNTDLVKKTVIPSIEDAKISTKTIVAATNTQFDIYRIFKELPIVEYILPEKKRGRKRREEVNKEIVKQHVPVGSIIYAKYENESRGNPLKRKNGNKKYFRNSVTIIMNVDDDKFINFKLSKNGKFQITGCKDEQHAVYIIKTFWEYVLDMEKNDTETHNSDTEPEKVEDKSDTEPEKVEDKSDTEPEKVEDNFLYKIESGDFKAILFTVMTNIDFSVGFKINREILDRYINSRTEFKSLLETSFGYTGVNIKFPMKKTIDHDLPYISVNKEGSWYETNKTYDDYLEFLKPAELKKELNKKRYNSFLVFHSGNVIMSGLGKLYMKEHYNIFSEIIKNSRNKIEEKLEVDK